MEKPGTGRSLTALAALAALLLLLVVWIDHQRTRAELLALLRDHAASLRSTLAAAARSNREAERLVEQQLAARLLDNARFLAALDARAALDDAQLAALAEAGNLFRINLFDPGGQLERATGGGRGGPGRGLGRGPGGGAGRGGGRGLGEPGGAGPGSGLLPRLLAGEPWAVSDVHATRWGEGTRLSAGARRSSGGAVVVNVDAAELDALRRQASLDVLLADIAAQVPEVAFVAFEQGELRLAHGDVPAEPPPPGTGEREVATAAGPALELTGPLELGPGAQATLRLGMRLDGVRRAERRMLLQLALSLCAALAVAGLGVGSAWLRRRYALLVVRHARAEEALRRRDRLAAMGELASTVAHEIRNPLNAIAMGARRLQREFAPAADAADAEAAEQRELLAVVVGESQRIDRIVREFVDFARPAPLARRATDLRALTLSIGEAARAQAEARGLGFELAADVAGEADLDPDRLREALGNLLRNAIEATPAGGRVRLAARDDGARVAWEIVDTGPGIGDDVRGRIFDLYFTTKPDGTGVGLALTHQVVTAHDGTIEVDSAPGAGTRMTVRLPRRAEVTT
ncbi:MAG: ATP-binding protein [Vicinamibacteria bacterium]|nr:ATP-binding protein [Vicinamibacteria bacterium]